MSVLLALSLTDLPVLPVLVFFAELCVVTLCTLRIIFISRGKRFLAPLIGFFEITIWLFAIGQVMQHLTDPACFLGFAGGFTLGNYLGMMTERWLALGTVVVRTVTRKDPAELIRNLQGARFGVTTVDAEGTKGPAKLVFTVVPRKQLSSVLHIVRCFDATAFYSVDDIQETGPRLAGRRRLNGVIPSMFRAAREAA